MIYQKKIESISFFSAFFLHIAALFLVFYGESTLSLPHKKTAPKVFVQTVQLKQSVKEKTPFVSMDTPPITPSKLIADAPLPVVSQKIEKIPVQTPTKPKTAQKPLPPQKKREKTLSASVNKKTPTVTEEKKEPNRELEKKQKMLQEKLAFLSASRKEMELAKNDAVPTVSSSFPSVKKIESLQIDSVRIEEVGMSSSWGTAEIKYRDQIAHQLKKSLKLQEKGAIKIKLTISSQGKILRQEIVNSESKKNLDYIQQMLPHLKFPAFDPHLFDGASTYTIFITLDNE